MDLGLPCINATIELLGDVGLRDKIGGIRSVNCPFTRLRFAEDHPVGAIENDKASEIGENVVCLAIRQLRSCTWFDAIPGLFPRFTVGGEVAESVMREFKQAYDDFKVVETKSGIFWRRVQGRSLWSSVHTQQMVALAEKGDWMPNDALKAQVIEQWSGITQTKLIEDGVREERVEEESRRPFKPEDVRRNVFGQALRVGHPRTETSVHSTAFRNDRGSQR